MAKLIDITGKAISGEWGTDDLVGNGVPVLRTTNFTNIGVVNFNNVVTRQIVKKSISEKLLRYGDIIIEKSGGSDKQPVGRVVFFEGENNKYLFNNFTGLLRVRDFCKWNPKYIFYSLFSNYANGGTIPFENRTTGLHNLQTDSYVNSVMIVERKIEEQTDIVTILDKVNQLINYEKKQLEDLDILVKSRFVEMFGDPVTNPLHWPICLLGEQIKFITSGSRGWAKYFTNDGAYFITIKNVKNSNIKIDDMQYIIPPNNAEAIRTKVQEGDLLISITADLGRTGVVSKEIAEHGGYINQHLTCVRLNQENVNPLYVSYYMESEAGKRQFNLKNQSAVKAGLNFESIRSLNLMLPPIELQHDYISFVKQVDKSKFVVTAKF